MALEIYQLLYYNDYRNKFDTFRIEILKKTTDTIPNFKIDAAASLKYKETDDYLNPIRSASLSIQINANETQPFAEFRDFQERDYKVIFYRNEVKTFEGFVIPEGIKESFVNPNWVISIIATDGLAGLKNQTFKYNNELPSEFVFLDVLLKNTGIKLPIAIFDDINAESFINPQGGVLDDLNERIIEPRVFLNDNDRNISAADVLNDILQKYNFCLCQHFVNAKQFNFLSGQLISETKILCWVIYRPRLVALTSTLLWGRVWEFGEYTLQDKAPFEQVLIPSLTRLGFFNCGLQTIRSNEGSEGLPTHVNANQNIRYKGALQNFRFEQFWKFKDTVLPYLASNFTRIGNGFYQYSIEDEQIIFDAASYLGVSSNIDPTQPLSTFSQAFLLLKQVTFEVPPTNTVININGSGVLSVGTSANLYAGLFYIIIHIDTNGNRRYLLQPPSVDGVFTINQLFTSSSTFASAEWVLDSDIVPDAFGNLTAQNISNTLFSVLTNQNSNINFDIRLPPTVEEGGTFEFYLSPLIVRTSLLSQATEASFADWEFTLENLNFAPQPIDLGIGEFHDTKRNALISTNLVDPVSVINADETTDYFLNGLKRIRFGKLENYTLWYSEVNIPRPFLLELTGFERIESANKTRMIFEGDVYNYVPYFSSYTMSAFEDKKFVCIGYNYNTSRNVTKLTLIEVCSVGFIANTYEKSIIFENEQNVLIDID